MEGYLLQRNNLFYYFKQQRALVVAFCVLLQLPFTLYFIYQNKRQDVEKNELWTNRYSYGNSF